MHSFSQPFEVWIIVAGGGIIRCLLRIGVHGLLWVFWKFPANKSAIDPLGMGTEVLLAGTVAGLAPDDDAADP